MQITVTYMTQLRKLVGVPSETLTPPAQCRVVDLLRIVASKHAEASALLLDPRSEVHPSLLVFVNDAQATGEQPLSDRDEVALLTPMAGGSCASPAMQPES